LQALIASLSKD